MAICKVDPSHLLPFDFSELKMVLFKKFLPISKSMLFKNCNSLITYKSSFSELFHFFDRNHGCVCSRSTLNTWICDLDQDPERQIRRFQFSMLGHAGPCLFTSIFKLSQLRKTTIDMFDAKIKWKVYAANSCKKQSQSVTQFEMRSLQSFQKCMLIPILSFLRRLWNQNTSWDIFTGKVET